ncbi:MAG: hypothetical protein J1E40_01130 [Oscillospiraceae bacterium]|nr:hypothetical protein [Oscillospiraceae bacterium]
MDKKIDNNYLDIAGTVMLALGIVFTGISMFSEKLEQKYNNLIGALLCVSLSHMFSVIRDYNDRQDQ